MLTAEAVFVTLLVFLGPSILVLFIGWRLSRHIQYEYQRILVRSAILSVALAPTVYGHGPMFASWVIFLAPKEDKFSYGFLPIAVFWFVSGGIACKLRWIKNRRGESADRT